MGLALDTEFPLESTILLAHPLYCAKIFHLEGRVNYNDSYKTEIFLTKRGDANSYLDKAGGTQHGETSGCLYSGEIHPMPASVVTDGIILSGTY
jgi:hypothetical protein